MFNYAKCELGKLNAAEVYRIKITSDEGGETRWISIDPATLDKITAVLVLAHREMDTERARKLDATVREIAARTPFDFRKRAPERMDAPIGSELWHGFMGDVLAASHNTRTITMDRRNELMQELYVVWTGDTSSDSE